MGIQCCGCVRYGGGKIFAWQKNRGFASGVLHKFLDQFYKCTKCTVRVCNVVGSGNPAPLHFKPAKPVKSPFNGKCRVQYVMQHEMYGIVRVTMTWNINGGLTSSGREVFVTVTLVSMWACMSCRWMLLITSFGAFSKYLQYCKPNPRK